VQSPELFSYQSRLYVAFVTSTDSDFFDLPGETQDGNIRISRIESAGAPTFTLLSDDTLLRKRVEPEIHYPTNDAPVVIYTQKAEGSEFGCENGNNMLFRARTAAGI
jgi:hypothetical protein